MPVVALVLALFAVIIGVVGICRAIHEHRTPQELRGDWWTQFEREFRTYAGTTARASRERRRHRGEAA